MWLGNTRTHACFYAQGRRSRGGSAAGRDDRTVQERHGCGSSSARRRNVVIVMICVSEMTCAAFEVQIRHTHTQTPCICGDYVVR